MEDILREKYRSYDPVRMAGGFTNATYLLKGSDPLLVAKVASLSNRDIENERVVLGYLKNKAFTPQMADTFMEDGTQVIITTFAEGQNGQAVLDAGDVRLAEVLFSKMGQCLAEQIHSHPFDGDRYGLRLGQTEPIRFDMPFMPAALRTKCESILSGYDVRRKEWVLTHGDYGAHNMLIDAEEKLTVIDWEWAEWFHPLVDLAWTCWNTKLHYPGIADRLLPTFLEAYQSTRPIAFSGEDLKAFVLYKLHTILSRMEMAGEEAQKKWIHRLEWTLETHLI